MTDKKVSALTDGTTANATDRIPVARSPFGSGDNAYITPAYLDTYMASTTKTLSNKTLAAPTLTGTVTLTGGTVNGTVLDISQTWGSTGTYTGLKYNVTDDGPANSASLLMDLQVGNSSKFKVSKSGTITSALAGGGTAVLYGGFSGYGLGFDGSGGPVVLLGNGAGNYRYRLATNFELANVSSIAWCSSWAATAQDTFITRAAAATLQLGAADTTLVTAPTAQMLQVQSWSSSTSPNQAGANFTISGSAGTGSGAGGSIIFQVAPATGAGGTTKNPYATALTIASDLSATFPGQILGKTGNQSSPAYAFSGATNAGMYAWNNSPAFTVGGTITYYFSSTHLNTTAALAFGSATATGDTILIRDAANTLALRNSTNAQTFRTYYRYDDASNYAFGYMEAGVTANTLILGSNKVGSPAQALTKLQINVDGTARLDYNITSANRWTTGSSFRTQGSSYVDSYVILSASQYVWLSSPASGVMLMHDSAGTDFSRLQFGGTTSSFPALKRSSTALHARLADDSAYAPFSAELVTVAAGTATPAGGSTAGRLLMGTTAGFGVYYGSGAPTVSAAQGSIYLRSDGSSTSTRLYVNTDGSTTWTAVTTAA